MYHHCLLYIVVCTTIPRICELDFADEMSNTRELLKTIEEQKGQLQRFERRLRDVVVAYKGVQKEKEALESIVKALDNPQETGSENAVSTLQKDGNLTNSEDDVSGKVLEEKVATLTKALSTLTEEKSRIETGFQADNKQLKVQIRKIEETLIGSEEKCQTLKNSYETQLNEMKSRVRSQQIEREKEQSDHAAMIRELQKLVALERRSKEELEVQVEEMSLAAVSSQSHAEKNSKYFNRIKELSHEVELLRTQLENADKKALQPQPLLISLQKEMNDMKTQHQMAVQQEQSRANEAEARLRQTARVSEDRVANLETRLSELSQMVGNYDRQRHQDQQAIIKLKERVAQLDLENTALAREATKQDSYESQSHSSQPEDDYNDSNLDIQALMSKMLRMKGMLNMANERSKNPIDLNAFFLETHLIMADSETDHKACKEELAQLKEEFERYKTRAQSALKGKNVRDNTTSQEINIMHDQIVELRHQMKLVLEEKEEMEKTYQTNVEQLRLELSEQRTKHKHDLSQAESGYLAKVSELETEMHKLRDRIMGILEDKDHEIRTMKLSLGATSRSSHHSPDSHSYDQWSFDRRGSESEGDSIAEELSQSFAPVSGETRLLHYAQEIARRDVEISNLRKSKHQLEVGLRDLQVTFQNREDVLQGETYELKSQVHRLQRSFSREGANLEYLKNVVLNYMMSADPNGRQHMLNAIAAILKFSSKELEAVKVHNSSWWWNAPAK